MFTGISVLLDDARNAQTYSFCSRVLKLQRILQNLTVMKQAALSAPDSFIEVFQKHQHPFQLEYLRNKSLMNDLNTLSRR